MSTLYIVATPIGNLEDITLRALRVLSEVDYILCEDTRVTNVLLKRHSIQKPLISYHQHSALQRVQEILQYLREGKNLALVSDAGTPGISDPGNKLIEEVSKELPEVKIIPIPGPSALTAIASVAGFPMDRFFFLGFPPVKKGRKKFFEEVATSSHPVIFYESPYRIIKSLEELQGILRDSPAAENYSIVVGRELTKKFETIYRGTTAEVAKQLKREVPKGEFVVIVRIDGRE
ncbi:MAG: 16S rRNA (cytidine(1402)-2'-O)-methyltransferase [Candidatus Wildermuthbacteria bacterium]|nr:16S rRNA (cytidine(1402)-2'-O)-methyltransferase [Candidatus Wildermuthbacteria bacterium]